MKTSELIDLLVKDLRPEATLNQLLAHASIAGTLIAGIAFFSQLGFRDDIGDAMATGRFLFKFVVTSTLAASSAAMFFRMGKPGVSLGTVRPMLLLSPALLIVAALLELSVTPTKTWITRAVGQDALNCLTTIPLLSVGPLVCLLYGMRRGAPGNPGIAGMIAGLAAAGISATFYASSGDEDSPLFVLLWYPIAVAIVALAGYLLGRRLLRW
jgi:hypothetical protein